MCLLRASSKSKVASSEMLAQSIFELLQHVGGGEDADSIVHAIDAAINEHANAAVMLARKENETIRLEELMKEHENVLAMMLDLQAQLEATAMSAARTREAMSEVEYEKETLRLEVEKLTKEKRSLVQANKDLNDKLQEEAGSYESLKADWQNKESMMLSTIQTQRRATRDIRNDVSNFQRVLSPERSGLDAADSTRRASAISEDVQMRLLKSQITERDFKIAQLSGQIVSLESGTREALVQLETSRKDIASLKAANSELEQQNSQLKEENELFTVLLNGKTKSGEMRAHLGANIGEEIVAQGGTTDALAETPMERQLKSEVKALTLYIEKILKKMMTNPEVAAALLMKSDDAEDEENATSPSAAAPYLAPTSPTKNRSSFMAFPSAAIDMVRGVSNSGKRSSMLPPQIPPVSTPTPTEDANAGDLLTVSAPISLEKTKRGSFFAVPGTVASAAVEMVRSASQGKSSFATGQ
ncbi:hypothetical protein BC830DRAFT_11789 [Chytriomyces sp. MP71]|nr:hypothetical protein BC830DRAFT_11789 [Chytriomyces sp. MP71]